MMTELKKLHIKLAIEKLNSEIWKIIVNERYEEYRKEHLNESV